MVSAYVATEVSNLATSLSEHIRRRFLEALRALLARQSVERHLPPCLAAERDDFALFGVTDSAILRLRTRSPLVVTMDHALAQKLAAVGRPVINFNRLRGIPLGVLNP